MKKINVITLGCAKNRVDSEHISAQLAAAGYSIVFDSDRTDAEVVVINTCGFIGDAKQESIDTILGAVAAKEAGRIRRLFVIGCLSERYADELRAEIPEVDDYFGARDLAGVVRALGAEYSADRRTERLLSTPKHYAYLKISEGCDRRCGYCAIPLIRGRHTSVPMEDLLDEARRLAAAGVRELIVIAQDTTCYGVDLYGRRALAELLGRLCRIDGIEWIRLHYAYPADFPEDVLDVMANRENVCNYLDIALQHISNPVLKNMRRHINKEETLSLLEKIRTKVPDIKIRTTLMVGFPGEGEEEFKELMDFVRDQRFDRMGAFAYSEEDDTFAAKNLHDDIPEEIKQQRLDSLMELQQQISQELNHEMVGSVQKVLIDRIENGTAIGRTQYDSPEVDPEVIINNGNLVPGEFVNVKITEALPFELIGEVIF